MKEILAEALDLAFLAGLHHRAARGKFDETHGLRG